MKLKIIDKLNNELNLFEYNPKLEVSKINIEHEASLRYATNGVNVNTIGTIAQRDITISVDFDSESDSDYDNKINTFYNFFRYEMQPFYLIDLDTNKRARVFLKSFNERKKEGLHKRLALDSELVFVMLDSVFESTAETIINTNIAQNVNYVVTLANNEADTYPIFELKNTTATSCDDFYLVNENQFSNYLIRIKELGFLPNTTLIIDNIKGEVLLNSLNVTKSIYQGSFFKFVKGNNTLKFFSTNLGTFNLKIKYRKRYYF